MTPTSTASSLLDAFLQITTGWRSAFPQRRSFVRALRQALGGLCCLGRRTLSRILWTNGDEQKPWAADYHLHSRCPWTPQDLFAPIWQHARPFCPGTLIGVALDDTRLRKTGRCIPQAFYQRDPLSPPFHVNLMLGLRFLQASVLLPTHRVSPRFGARALPVRFEEAPRVKRPGNKASPEQIAQWKAARKVHNLSRQAVRMIQSLRADLDAAGGYHQTLVVVGDGSFSNRVCWGTHFERTELLVRTRKDAVLCRRAEPGSRRFYDPHPFTPEAVRFDPAIPWQTTRLNYGAKRRQVRFKDLGPIHWQGGARRRPLRLIVIAPTPYRKRKSGKLYYRLPAYLLTSDLTTPTPELIQLYLDRWEIEINHREEKDTLGVGQAQLWNKTAVPKQPVLAVAAYSALLLAGLLAFGAARTEAYAPLPRWRRGARRPSCQDLVTLLRKEAIEHPEKLHHLGLNFSAHHILAAAAA